MARPQYQHAVAQRSVRASRPAAFETVSELDFLTPDGVGRSVRSDEPPWRRVWHLDGPFGSRYVALAVHVVAGPDVVDPYADDIDLCLVVSLTCELTDDTNSQTQDFDELAQSIERFATAWAERLSE